jgi:O-antigen/teichoic acid export membrane protein
MQKNNQPADHQARIAAGVIVSWGSQFIVIAAGFIIPRWIDHGLGRATLGIWDLAWSLVSYLNLLEAGIGSSVNRHVALHLAEGDLQGVNRVVSSVAIVQRIVGVVVLGLTVAIAVNVPLFLHNQPVSLMKDARWLVLILGTSVAFQFSGAIYTGVLTGCHRWATHHTIYACTNLINAVGMCWVLKAGFGIVALAIVHLGGEIFGRVVRAVIAHRACPGLSIRVRNTSRETIRAMMGFGGRMFVGQMSGVLMIQTVNVLIATYLGPAALALFARPRSLIRQAAVFPQKYAIMLAPASAALSTGRPQSELQLFVKDSTRYGICISLPVMIFLAIDGGLLLRVWMGGSYADASLMVLLTLGFMAEIVYQPLNNLVLGLNLHGRPGFVSLLAAALAAVFTYFALASGGGMKAVAVAIGLPWSIANGIYVPYYACRRLHISLVSFFKDVWTVPLLCAIPFALALATGQYLFPLQPIWAMASGGCAGALILLVLYWLWIMPEGPKVRVRQMLGFPLGAKPLPVSADKKFQPELIGHD